ncbi:hypothetical protein F5141DRAFT_1063499 [Pisolithus sp. B1]|nr:hypothetical protein F5141DRAFT_1063499 [Pisolithus sp. B1]
MFPGELFNNPWHSWHSPNQLEDVQTVRQSDLFDDDMSSTAPPFSLNLRLEWTPLHLPPMYKPQHEHRLRSFVPIRPRMLLVVPLPASKCHYEEVNFSRSLRQGLYEKEEIINKLRKKVQQQGKPNNTVTSLQSDLKQKESELLGLHQALDIQRGQEQTIRQYETQFEELRRQFELNMRSQFDSLQATRMAEIDTRVREEVTKLSSTLQVEKERELANIEQRYARFRKPAYVAKHLDAKTDPPAGSLPSHPQASTPSTPNLDAIKRIRKGQGISKRTRLIGVEMDDNGLDRESALPEGCKETGGGATPGTQDDQLDPPPVTAVVEAVTKSVETALRTLLESGGHFSIGAIPQSPRQENHKLQLEKAMEPNHHRDFILAEVHRLFKEKLGIAQDIDFITHVPANTGDVRAYEYKDGPSPDTDNVAFDLMQNHSSPWNSFILSFLLREFQACCTQEAWPIRKDNDYIEEVLHERYKRLQTLWRNARPKLTAKGLIEMPAEQEARLVEENLIQWLQHLIKSLGEHGMSLEESSVENGIENVLQVKKMEWRKNIDKELEIIDLQRILDKDIFCSQGAKPLPRKHAPDNPTSSRAPVTALPAALYNEEWISQLTERQRESLKISKEPFPWMKIIAT